MKTDISSIAFIVMIALDCPKGLGAVGIHVPGRDIGNSSLAGPFNTSTSSRLQQVYSAEGLGPIPTNSAFLIEGIYFRVDENAGPFAETFPRVQVDLSTTSRGPDGLSPVFSENVGPDETIVFGPGPLYLSGYQPGFTVGVMFAESFLYDPTAGNLLVDIRNFGPGNASELDAFDTVGDSVSIVLGRADATSAFASSSRGLATEFWVDIVPIPEPSTAALLLMGLLAVGWKLRHLHRRSSTTG